MKKAIAKIKLAPGNVSWYDSLNNIYLTVGKTTEALVYEDSDLTNIKKGLRYNYITLREGTLPSLNTDIKEKVPVVKSKTKKESPKKEVKQDKVIEDIVEPIVEVESTKVEKTKERPQEIKKPLQNSKNKRKNKSKEEITKD